MCLLCITEAELITRNILPNWFLYKSTNDSSKEWPKGYYGVVSCNDPLFVFPPIKSEPHTMEFINEVSDIDFNLKFSLDEGYEFVKDCIKVGFDPEHNSNGTVLFWFFERVYKVLHPDYIMPLEEED